MKNGMFTLNLESLILLGAVFFIHFFFIQTAASTHVAVPVASATQNQTDHHLRCRCFSSQPCWPSANDWATLNATTNGRLIATYPTSRVCHDPFYDPVQCELIQQRYFDKTWRRSQPSTVRYLNWQHQRVECTGFDKSLPCIQATVPLYTLNASSIADVQATIRFANQHNIRLVVKNTGHDLLGRSTGAEALSLWTHYMKNISVVDNFIPEGAPLSESTNAGTHAIILGAGVQWLEAYMAADAKGRIIVGGSASVGTSGGYCLGGGYSPLSRRHGLCVDNVLQYKVVTADGELRVANAYQNQNLFWALRGGGPGFGIVVEAVYRTYPKFEKGVIYLTAHIFTIGRKSRTKVIRAILGRQLQWSKEGWAGSVYVQGSLVVLIYFLADSTVDDVKASFESFMDEIRSIGAFILDTSYENHPTFLSAFRSFMPITRDGLTGIYRLVGSRLIQQSFFEDSRNMDALADTMSDIQDDVRDKNAGFLDQVVDISHGLTRGYLIDLTVGGQVANNDMNGTETSVTPAWRKALALILVVMD
ncbi:hypothetical protein BGW41_004136 [Actinomortierella wolfii]|nr:hypothetical protein BGW41_004136 [Actinomortierella wolfii]